MQAPNRRSSGYPAGAGVYTRSAAFQSLIDILSQAFLALLGDKAEPYSPSPVLSWDHLERCGYSQKFPQIVAAITPLIDRQGEEQLAMLPAACLPLYPLVAEHGPVQAEGLLVTTRAQCFRQEAVYSEVRLRAFTMSEWVFFGSPVQAAGFRERLCVAVGGWLETLGLAGGRLQVANDPFYGRGSDILIEAQLDQNLKLEMVLPIANHGDVACFSFNHHGDFFARRFDIVLAQGGLAHSACVGVGLERLALAMIHHHGPDSDGWPALVRRELRNKA